MPTGPKFTVTLEAPRWPTDAAGIRRLRAMLKRLGRGYGLRCVDMRPAEPTSGRCSPPDQRGDNEQP